MNNSPSLFKIVLPNFWAPLSLLALILLSAFSIIGLSHTVIPFLSWLKVIILDESKVDFIKIILVFFQIFSIILSFYLVMVGYYVLSGIYSYNSYKLAASGYNFEEHSLSEIIFRSLSWNFYRLGHILLPPVAIGVIGIILIMLMSYSFNILLALASLSIEIATFIMTFLVLVLAFGFIFSLLISLWNLIMTIFGTDCAVSEPHLSNNTIRERSAKLLFTKPANIMLILLYLSYILVLLVQLIGLAFYNDLITVNNLGLIAAIIMLDIILFAGLRYLKSSLYISSVLYLYNKITINKNSVYKNNLDYSADLF